MQRKLRTIERIDYRKLHNTGIRQCKQMSSEEKKLAESNNDTQSVNSETSESENISSNLSTSNNQSMKAKLLIDEIDDFIDENPINQFVYSEDIAIYIEKISKMRTELRSISMELQNMAQKEEFQSFSDDFTQTMASIKEYIIKAKSRATDIQKTDKYQEVYRKENEERNQNKRAAEFLISEVTRLSSELLYEFEKECDSSVSDEEITRRKDDLSSNLLKLDQLSNKFQKCLQIIPEDFHNKEDAINGLVNKYQGLIKKKEKYEKFISSEIQERELSKQKTFQISSLNIKLSKFNGYDSNIDVYTFQREFEKLHLKNTPKNMLSDLLKYNYLKEPALSLVKSLEGIDQIWLRLKKAYGDCNILLNRKLAMIQQIGPIWKIKENDRIQESLMALINGMQDLISLAKYHNIQNKLYYGNGIELIYKLMGDTRVAKWITLSCDQELEGEELWTELIKFLEKDLRVHQELGNIKRKSSNQVLQSYCASNDSTLDNIHSSHSTMDNQADPTDSSYVAFNQNQNADQENCFICGEKGHYRVRGPNGNLIIQYYSCKKFVEMNPLDRFKELRKKELCYMCLYPGASQDSFKHKNGHCQIQFTCPHSSHENYNRKKHVLVCHEHRNNQENKNILEEYRRLCILNRKDVPEFSKNIKLSFMSRQSYSISAQPEAQCDDDSIITENGIYLLHKIQVDNEQFTVFFDSGCSDMVIRHDAVLRLGHRAKQEIKGPIPLGGVGNMKMESKYGIYQVRLPLTNGKNAVLAGICLDAITTTFPSYNLHEGIKNDIFKAFAESGKDPSILPKFPESIGGDIDIMIGTKYLRYHPESVFSLPSGLTIFESCLVGVNGLQGVIGGPHPSITQVDSKNKTCQYAYNVHHDNSGEPLSNQIVDKHIADISSNIELSCSCLESIETNNIQEHHVCHQNTMIEQKYFENAENAASEILYRCVNCRNCQKCRNGERIELISIKEEVEQDLINKSVTLDSSSGVCTATLPFTSNAASKLAPNRKKALAIYNSQIKKLNKDESRKKDVIESEKKLQNLGYVDYVRNLPQPQQLELKESKIQNFIPWSSVWKENSITTPCRLVFNASLPTNTGFSMNDILAKGTNNMNILVEIFIRWRSHMFAFHTDVQKMYNSVQLNANYWCYQRYIWQEQLSPNCIPEEKVIKTLIYGVKSSGNQAERALRMIADMSKEEYSKANQIIQKDTYVDDCLSGQNTLDDCYERADEIEIVLARGGFALKGFTFSGHDPPDKLSDDKKSIHVGGMIWYSRDDKISLDVSPIDFSSKQRGKRNQNQPNIPELLTRRQCLSKVAEIFDLTGLITPITSAMKMDLHVLVQRKLNWDDAIPDDLRHIWISHFEMIQELSSFKFDRAIVPIDAISLELDTIECGDASREIACAAIYARFLRQCGIYSCQLIFARSKLVPEGMSIPRAELLAANLNAHTGEVVKRALRSIHKKSIKLTDSQVTMHWINNHELPLKQWTRNRVNEVLRFSIAEDWAYVNTDNMPADIGTRRGASIHDILPNSTWLNGHEWMRKNQKDFPVKSYEEIKQKCNEASNASNEEIKKMFNSDVAKAHIGIQSHSPASNYLIHPLRFRFRKVVRVLAYVKKFIQACKQKKDSSRLKSIANISDDEYQDALNYYFRLATLEIKENMKEEKYAKLSFEKDKILYYKGRILPSQQTHSISTMTDVMLDLSQTTFCVPLVLKSSPLAKSIIDEIHWHHEIALHSGVETILRYTMKYAYILEGRDLVESSKKSCIRCKILAKRALQVSMGPVSDYQLTIAPAYYVSQSDIVGPFKGYSYHNKRVTIKIWFVVFVVLQLLQLQ